MSITADIAEEVTADAGVGAPRVLVPAYTSATTAGWRTGGRGWRFRYVTASVQVPERLTSGYPHPDATVGLQGFGDNTCALVIAVSADAGAGASVSYGYDIGTAKTDGIAFPLPAQVLPVRAGDMVKMEITHNTAASREEFTVTVTRPGQPPVANTVLVDIPAGDADRVYYRHAGWNCYIDAAAAVLPPDADTRLWLFRGCHATGENTETGQAADGGIFGPPASWQGPWAAWQEIATKTGSPADDVVVLAPGWPWEEKHINFGMFLNPRQHKPVPKLYTATTAGWRTGGHGWRFRHITATVQVPQRLAGVYPHPDATVGLQGFGDNTCALAIGVSADAGAGASVSYGYDIGTAKTDGIAFPLPAQVLPVRAGDMVKMEITHNTAASREEFTVTVTKPGRRPVAKTVLVDIPTGNTDRVYYRHAGWNCYIDAATVVLPPGADTRLWLFRGCHATGENTETGQTADSTVFGPWATWQETATRTGGPTDAAVLYPGWPWKERRVNFAMRLRPASVRPKPMMWTWFPDAGAGASSCGLELAAKQFTDQAAAGFGGAQIIFLGDNVRYTNADAQTFGYGTENWRRVLKQILRTANQIPGGFGIGMTLSSQWPVSTNNIDPNDDAQLQQLVSRYAKITRRDMDNAQLGVAKELPLPELRTRDAGLGDLAADFLFADTLVAATVARVTAVTDEGPELEFASLADVTDQTTKITATDANGTAYHELEGTRYAGLPAGIPDCAYAESHGIDYRNVLLQWGPEPADPGFTGKIDADGNRRRMADWQYLYQTDLRDIPALLGYRPNDDPVPRAGDFILFGTYREGTGQVMSGTGSVPQHNRCYVVSFYDTAGVQKVTDFWRENILDAETIGLLRANAAQNPSDAVFEDSLRFEVFASGPLWALGLLDAIGSATGDAARKYAPVFAARRATGQFARCAVVSFDNATMADRLREERIAAMARKYEHDHIDGIKKWAADFGYRFGAQAEAGAPGIAGGEASLDIAQGDNLAAGDGFRNLAAAANMGGTNLVSNESLTFVATDYSTPWLPLAAALNSYWGAGANQVIYHGSTFPKTFNAYHDAWPGWEYAFSPTGLGVFDARQVYWADMSQLSGYAARTQAVLQGGRANVDLAVLEGTDKRYTMPAGNALQHLLNAGYSYNILDEAMLDLPAATVTNRVLAASGPSYRALIVNQATILSVAAVDKLIGFAQAGLPVILYNSPITRVYGIPRRDNDDQSLAGHVNMLVRTGNVMVASSEDEVIANLTGVGVTPAASYSVPGLVSVHRSARGGDYYLLWSEGTNLASPAAQGDTRIRVAATRGLRPGDRITIDTGAAAETATVQAILAPVPSGPNVVLAAPLTRAHAGPVYNLASPANVGDWSICVVTTEGLQPGDQIVIDTGAAAEPVCVAAIPSPGPYADVMLASPLTKAHVGPTSFGTTFGYTPGAGVSAAVRKAITLAGSGTPYALDAWTGQIAPLAEYTAGAGTVTFELTLPPQAAALVALVRPDGQAAVHATSSACATSEDGGHVLYADGKLAHRATAAGTYTVRLSNGRTRTFTITPEPVLSLNSGWDLTIESWGPDPSADFANPTISAKTAVSFGDVTLGLWSALPASASQLAELGVTAMSQVAGIGTYSRQFTLPAGWTGADGAYLQLAHNDDMIVAVTVNGRVLRSIDPFTDRLDLSPCLQPGTNRLTVRIDTTLNNRVPGKATQPYGLTAAQLIPYVQTVL